MAANVGGGAMPAVLPPLPTGYKSRTPHASMKFPASPTSDNRATSSVLCQGHQTQHGGSTDNHLLLIHATVLEEQEMKQRDETFEAARELAAIQKRRDICRRRRYRQSRLMLYHRELIELRTAGASIADVQLWLRRSHRISVARSTIWRYLQSHHRGD